MPEGALALTDITTNNMSSSKHGFAKKGTGVATDYYDGTGSFSSTTNITITDFTNANHTHANNGQGGGLGRTSFNYTVLPIQAFTAPVNGNFAWINQGSGSVDTSTYTNAIQLIAPAVSGNNIRIRKMSAPGTPYTVTLRIIPQLFSGTSNFCGFCWRQSSDGKLSVIGINYASDSKVSVFHFTDATTFSATVTNVSLSQFLINQSEFYLVCTDDGTNRIVSVSSDGTSLNQCHSEGRTVFLTADEIGFCCDSNSSTKTSKMILASWAIT